jgi:hypothetical protein
VRGFQSDLASIFTTPLTPSMHLSSAHCLLGVAQELACRSNKRALCVSVIRRIFFAAGHEVLLIFFYFQSELIRFHRLSLSTPLASSATNGKTANLSSTSTQKPLFRHLCGTIPLHFCMLRILCLVLIRTYPALDDKFSVATLFQPCMFTRSISKCWVELFYASEAPPPHLFRGV